MLWTKIQLSQNYLYDNYWQRQFSHNLSISSSNLILITIRYTRFTRNYLHMYSYIKATDWIYSNCRIYNDINFKKLFIYNEILFRFLYLILLCFFITLLKCFVASEVRDPTFNLRNCVPLFDAINHWIFIQLI